MSTDASRLAALLSYDLLDTPPEPPFDDIVLLARTICRTPVALVSLVAADRQWFKAKAGVDLAETPLEQSVCVHAIREREILVIPDLTHDPRTRANTLVTDGPQIRFYAGAVLRTPEGEALGAVCVIDTVARPGGLADEQRQALLALARQTMLLLQYRRAVHLRDDAVRKSADRAHAVESAQQAGGIGTFEWDVPGDTLFPSLEFCRIFGLAPVPSMGAADIEALVVPEDRAAVAAASRPGSDAPQEVEYRIRRPSDGAVRWIVRRGEFERDAGGRLLRLRGAVQDVTERKAHEDVQHTLNQELSHRIKNTLAMVDAIATQTLRHAADQPAVEAFGRRVQALGRAHDVLLHQSMAGASVRATIEAVVGLIADLRRFDLSGPDLDLNPRSVLSFSLLIHELAANAQKYGALSREGGRVAVTWEAVGAVKEAQFSLDWREEGGPAVAPPERRGFGSRLIQSGLSGTGQSNVRYLPEGVHATFRVPLSFMSG